MWLNANNILLWDSLGILDDKKATDRKMGQEGITLVRAWIVDIIAKLTYPWVGLYSAVINLLLRATPTR